MLVTVADRVPDHLELEENERPIFVHRVYDLSRRWMVNGTHKLVSRNLKASHLEKQDETNQQQMLMHS